MSEGRTANVALLRRLSPLDGMKNDNLAALARKVTINELAAGRTLFKEGDADRKSFWLVTGMVELRDPVKPAA